MLTKLFVTVCVAALLCIVCIRNGEKTDGVIRGFVEKNIEALLMGVVVFLACYVRVKLLDYESGDYVYYEQWYEYLKAHGGIAGLKDDIGNYMEGYMLFLALLTYFPVKLLYGIKVFSVLFDFLTAFLVQKMVRGYFTGNYNRMIANICFAFTLFVPTIIFNSAYWGQCDSIYTFFLICSIYCYGKEKWNLVFICMGCAFAFKLQAIFLMPLYLVLYVKDKKFSILKFGLIPFTYFIWSIPAYFAGKPVSKIIQMFLSYGTGTTTGLTNSFNNLYTLVLSKDENVNHYIRVVGVTLTLILIVCSMAVFVKIKWEADLYKLITVALYFVILITYFLPGMHERYLYIGDVLCIVWWVMSRKRELWYIPSGILMFSLLSYMRYITGVWHGDEWNILTEINGLVSVVYFFFVIKTLIILYQELKEKELIENRQEERNAI